MWVHPGKAQPRSRSIKARRMAGGILRARRPMFSASPSPPVATRPQSQATLRNVSAETRVPSFRVVHEGGWTVTSGADGAFAFHSPAGTLLAPDSPRELVDDTLGWLREWADEHKLDLGPDVNLPQWDGKTPDYDGAVGWLLAAGQ